ncbi:hypothetical protein HOLleu_06460 [Holothuria leucospilota]|uniref:Uncharacterized protein n=1 Tax=Holothuria leucospilota TaxID=206669 RepID=A0A9Q1HIY0_HOLLE|nr:hypothetical protein HOLleu_06460 [Holothuria leucospilota]
MVSEKQCVMMVGMTLMPKLYTVSLGLVLKEEQYVEYFLVLLLPELDFMMLPVPAKKLHNFNVSTPG